MSLSYHFGSGSGFFSTVRDHIEQQYGNSFFFRRGCDKKHSFFKEGRLVKDNKYDMIVFRDIQRKFFGGKLRLVYLENGIVERRQGCVLRTQFLCL